MPCGEASVTRMQKFTWWHLITRSRPWMTRPQLTWSFFFACVRADRCFFSRWLDMSCSELPDCWFYVRFCVCCERFWSLSVCLSALSRSVHLCLRWECVVYCVCFCVRTCCAKVCVAKKWVHIIWHSLDGMKLIGIRMSPDPWTGFYAPCIFIDCHSELSICSDTRAH